MKLVHTVGDLREALSGFMDECDITPMNVHYQCTDGKGFLSLDPLAHQDIAMKAASGSEKEAKRG